MRRQERAPQAAVACGSPSRRPSPCPHCSACLRFFLRLLSCPKRASGLDTSQANPCLWAKLRCRDERLCLALHSLSLLPCSSSPITLPPFFQPTLTPLLDLHGSSQALISAHFVTRAYAIPFARPIACKKRRPRKNRWSGFVWSTGGKGGSARAAGGGPSQVMSTGTPALPATAPSRSAALACRAAAARQLRARVGPAAQPLLAHLIAARRRNAVVLIRHRFDVPPQPLEHAVGLQFRGRLLLRANGAGAGTGRVGWSLRDTPPGQLAQPVGCLGSSPAQAVGCVLRQPCLDESCTHTSVPAACGWPGSHRAPQDEAELAASHAQAASRAPGP